LKLIPKKASLGRRLRSQIPGIEAGTFKTLRQFGPRERRKYLNSRIDEVGRGSRDSIRLDRYYGDVCGKHGTMEVFKDGSKRYRPRFCNLTRLCWDCFRRHRNLARLKEENRIVTVAKAFNVPFLVTPVYTFHPEIQEYIKGKERRQKVKLLNKLSGLAADNLKTLLGVGKKRGRDVTGIISVLHTQGSKNPFKDNLHFHLVCVPIALQKDGKFRRLPYFLDEKRARDLWQETQESFCREYGIELKGDKTNVHLSYIPTAKTAQVRHKIRYIFRSLVDDIFKAAKYVSEESGEFVWVEDVGDCWMPHVDKRELLYDALVRCMELPGKFVRVYGFFTNLKKNAPSLGIVEVEEKEREKPALEIPCEFKRKYGKRFYKDIGKWLHGFEFYVKHGGRDWEPIPDELVVGLSRAGPAFVKWRVGSKWVGVESERARPVSGGGRAPPG